MLVATTASCCVANAFFDWIKGNLAQIQPKNHQNVQKTHFLQKVPGVNGLKTGTVSQTCATADHEPPDLAFFFLLFPFLYLFNTLFFHNKC